MERGYDRFDLLTGLFGLLIALALLGALVVAAVLLWRRFAPGAAERQQQLGAVSPAATFRHPSAMAEQTLAERLARGEIDVIDYEERIAALRRNLPAVDASTASPPAGSPPPPPSSS